jgi:hypothetical protein
VIAARSHRVAQSGKPGMLDQRGVSRKLRPGHPARVKRGNILVIGLQALLLHGLGLAHQLLDLIGGLGICRPMLRVNEIVAGIVSGVQGANAVEFAKEYGGQQMVDGVRIVRVTLGNLRKLLDGPLIVHVIEVLEGGGIERVGRPKSQFRLSQGERNRQRHQGAAKDREFPKQGQSLEAVYPRRVGRYLWKPRQLGNFAYCKVILACSTALRSAFHTVT